MRKAASSSPAKTPSNNKPQTISDINKEIAEYNRKHNTFISYGKYIALKELEKTSPSLA